MSDLDPAVSLLIFMWCQERAQGKVPIFDLNGCLLSPPNPSAARGGVPLGGMGSGSMTRGVDGLFGRWCMEPGKYVCNDYFPLAYILFFLDNIFYDYLLHCSYNFSTSFYDFLCIRIKRGTECGARILAVPLNDGDVPTKRWGPFMDAASAEYRGLHPRAWSVFRDVVFADITVTVQQISPFIPHSYSESSFPIGVFEVSVENHSGVAIEVSLMLSFQNGFGGSDFDDMGNLVHHSFIVGDDNSAEDGNCMVEVCGVCMARSLCTS